MSKLKSKIIYSVNQFAQQNQLDNFAENLFNFQQTRKEFAGDLTLVVFPFSKAMQKSPQEVAETFGALLQNEIEEIKSYNVVKGFLNLELSHQYWINTLLEIHSNDNFGKHADKNRKVVLEYCGPNTNKPLHFGHIRNISLGYAMANILDAYGYKVHKVNILNDRGIQICKSMLGWLKYFNGESPETSGKKGDHLVAEAYVKFEQEMRAQAQPHIDKGMEKNKAFLETELMQEARAMLIKWENNDEEVRSLWKKMNSWVYDGFNQTYERFGVDFEKNYYESDTWKLGKSFVEEGLKTKIFYQKEDGSTWIDLSDKGLDEKIVLRSDGTSVYLTQDLGTANERSKDFSLKEGDLMIYVVGDEQNYHFKVLKLTLEKMGMPYANGIYHLSYGMVDLPGGAKMKTREGTSVDADDLMDEVIQKAKEKTQELGKLNDLNENEKELLYKQIGLAAIKYFILKISPKKRMVFDPEESISLNGHTGPFIQYTGARINSVIKNGDIHANINESLVLKAEEIDLINLINQFPERIESASINYDPSEIANYAYDLAKSYNKFYTEHPILKTDDETKNFRLLLSKQTKLVLNKSLQLLGIASPEVM